MSISRELLVQFTSFLDTIYLRVCPTTRCIIFAAMMSWGCAWVHEMYQGYIFWQKTKKDTTWSDSWMSSVLHNCSDCNPVVFSLLFHVRKNVQRKQKVLETRVLERQFFAPVAATMIYYEDCMTLPG